MSPLNLFLEYWQNAHASDLDSARGLYRAYQMAVSDLEDLRAQTLKYIMPVKNSKGVWHVGFQSDKIDDVALLASNISAAEEKIESIAYDIERVMELAGGPRIQIIVDKREEARGAISRAAGVVRRQRSIDEVKNRTATIEEILLLPDVAAAEEALKRARAENEPKIAELSEKLVQLNEIINKDGR